MRKSCLAVVVTVLLSAPAAAAQLPGVIAACQADARGVCAGAPAEGGQFAACIQRNFQTLAEPCKAALVRAAAVRDACRGDIRQQCLGIRPGASRLLFCVKAHYAALGGPCREAIGQAAERKLH